MKTLKKIAVRIYNVCGIPAHCIHEGCHLFFLILFGIPFNITSHFNDNWKMVTRVNTPFIYSKVKFLFVALGPLFAVVAIPCLLLVNVMLFYLVIYEALYITTFLPSRKMDWEEVIQYDRRLAKYLAVNNNN